MLPISNLTNFAVVVIFLIYWLVAFTILYHLTRFGVGVVPKKLSFLFLLGSLALFTVSLIAYTHIT
jgi:hypothetical protein